MTIEERLKNLIMRRYKSMREFSIIHDIPYTTLKSILLRGVGNSSVSNVLKICKALGISADALADGEIVPVYSRSVKPGSNTIEINDVLEDTRELLHNGVDITLDGVPINQSGIESIIDAMNVGIEIAKKKTKS